MARRHYAKPLADGGWKLTLPLKHLLIELNAALRKVERGGAKPMLPPQDETTLTAILLAAEFDSEFPTRLPLGPTRS
jgi:hypothetical protein